MTKKKRTVLKEGNPETEFINLLAKYERMIYKICMAFSHNNTARVKDLYQESVINLWKAYRSYDYQKGESAWVYRICLNAVISQYRTLFRNTTFESYPSKMDEWIAQDQDDELLKELYSLISKLTPQEQALAYLYIDGYSEKDIAEMLDISISNVGVKIHRLKQKLKKIHETE